MPFDVAVEEPDARVVGAETEDDVAVGSDHEGVSTHGDFGEGLIVDVVARELLGADDGLEGVAVEMEGVLAWIVVVEDDFDNVVLFENVRVDVDAIDGGIAGCFARSMGGVETRYLRADVRHIVEKRTGRNVSACRQRRDVGNGILVGAVTKVAHCHVETNRVIHFVK